MGAVQYRTARYLSIRGTMKSLIQEDSCDGCSTVQDSQILVDQGNNEILDITINNGFPLSLHISIEHIIYRPIYTDSASF
jgi:hypothetical protein